MRTIVAVVTTLLVLSALTIAAQAQPPDYPGVIELRNPALSAGQCNLDNGSLEAQATISVLWDETVQVPITVEATLSVDGGPAVDVSSSFDPNPIVAAPGETQTDASGRVEVSGVATRTVWTITASPEGYAPVDLEKINESRNPAGFCAHLLECHPSYTGACLPNGVDFEDVDCAGGDGDGPHFVEGPITVVGPDYYELDTDGDGIACELADPPAAAPVVRQPTFTG